MKKFLLFTIILILNNCENTDYSNLTPEKLSEIQKKTIDFGFQLISFTSLASNFTKDLIEIEFKYQLFSYIFYIKSVNEKYSESNLEKFMNEFKSLLDFNEDHFKLSFIIVVAVDNEKYGMFFGETYEKKFDKNGVNVFLLKSNLDIEIQSISNHNEFVGFLVQSLKTGLEGKIIKPSKKWWIVFVIILIIVVCIVGLVVFCCCKKRKKNQKNKLNLNNSEPLIAEN